MSGPSTVAASLAAGRRRGRNLVVFVALAVAITALVVGAVVVLVTQWWIGLAAAAIVAGAVWGGFVAPRLAHAEERSLRFAGPMRSPGPAEARLLNLIEGLAPGAGLARPQCFVIDDPSANALTVGRDPRHGCVVVTAGLVERLSRMELEAVVAHALVQLRDGSTIGPTLALSLGGARFLARLAGETTTSGAREADLAAVSLTRYPPGLSSALRVLATIEPVVPAGASPLVASLWLVPPGDPDLLAARIGALEEL